MQDQAAMDGQAQQHDANLQEALALAADMNGEAGESEREHGDDGGMLRRPAGEEEVDDEDAGQDDGGAVEADPMYQQMMAD